MCLIHWRGITLHYFQLNTEIFVCVLPAHVPNNGIWGPEKSNFWKWNSKCKFLNMIPLSTVKTEASSWARILHVQSIDMTADAWCFFTKSHCQLLAWHAYNFFVIFAGSKWKGIDKVVISMRNIFQGKTLNFLVHGHVTIPKKNLYSQVSGYTASFVHFLFTWNESNPNTLVAL